MTPLYGHDDAVAAFRAALDDGKLHHAWLITGPEGIGKALFARKAAMRVLAEGQGPVVRPGLDVPDEHQTARLMESGTHPDFKLIKREVWKGNPPNDHIVPEADRSGGEEPARSIRVKQIRALGATLGMRPGLSDRRIIIFDSADDLETAGANALLKMLEEPPQGTTFLLVSHAPERLLPTIRSRCRMLRLSPIGRADMEAALRIAVPEAGPAEIAELAAAGGGSPGRATTFRGLDIAALDQAMQTIAGTGDPTNQHRSALAQSLAGKAAQPRFEAFLDRAPSFIAAAARARTGRPLAEALTLWERASELSRIAVRQSFEPQATAFEMGTIIAGLATSGGRP